MGRYRLLKAAPQATFHLGFDKDVAGKQFVANFEDIASKQSPVAPGNVPADMRDFMESFDKQPKTIKELLSFNDENYSLLPMSSNSSTWFTIQQKKRHWSITTLPFCVKKTSKKLLTR